MSKRTKVEVLFDSVYAINQALQKEDNPGRGVLQANVDHIKQCLEKEEYTSVLTEEQTTTLNTAVSSAKDRIKTLPVPEKDNV